MAITEAAGTESRLELVRKLIAKAASTDSAAEAEALTERAAELCAKYGIDQAMAAASGQATDATIDKVIWAVRPYSKEMQDLLYQIATTLGGMAKGVKQWDPDDHGGRTKGAWHFGLRVFAHQSDMIRIEVMYTSLRNQALQGAARIKGYDKFAQDQRAHRISYFEGFTTAVWSRLRRAEDEAREAQKAEDQRKADEALLAGTKEGPGVELVLADRKSVVKAAYDLAVFGITPERRAELDAQSEANRERWAEMDRKAAERRQARIAEQASCERCQQAKSGYCASHRDMRPTMGRQTYQRTGAYFGDGYEDGSRASLGTRPGSEVGRTKRGELQ